MVSTTATKSQMSAAPYEVTQASLVKWGALMFSVYVIYLLVFPLTPTIHQSDRVLEIEQMLREGRKWFAIFYAIGLGILFYAFWQIMKTVHAFSNEYPEQAKSLRAWVLGIGLLCSVALLGMYPITALDVVLYVVRARLWALYDGSPMLALPADFPQDPYIRFAGEYHSEVSPYGPVWELIAQIPIRLGVLEIAAGVIAMKLICLLSYLGLAVLLGWFARQDTPPQPSYVRVSGLTALTFFALNPLVLMEAIGNGHNDMLMLAFMTLGLVSWQRGRWAWAAFALTLATLVKVTGLILLPLFGMAVLADSPDWRTRILRGFCMAVIFMITAGVAYRLTGPFPDVFVGAQHAMFDRWGYTPAYAIHVIAREIHPDAGVIRSVIAQSTRGIFVLFYGYLSIRLLQRKISLIQAGFLAYFSQLLLGTTFRIWYPLWLIPFAALGLNSRTFWRTFLFGITAELGILMYLIVWRWKLRDWEWGLAGPFAPYWQYWTVMTLLTAPWVFGIPLLGPKLLEWRDRGRFNKTFWI